MPQNSECSSCGLSQSTRHVCVWGIGPKRSQLMFIGETPSARDTKLRQSFQGEAGQMFRKELRKVGIEPDECYVTTLVKCRPPDNQKLKTTEIKACHHYTTEEVESVNPEIVVLLGATALKFIKKTGITELHGSIVEVGGRKYFPMFHPAAALRDPGKLPLIQQDLRKLKSVLDGTYEDPQEISWNVLTPTNSRQFLDAFKASPEFSFDCETTGLLVHRPDFRINCISFTLSDLTSWVLPLHLNLDHAWAERLLRKVHLLAKSKRAIGQNGKYDNNCLQARYGLKFHLYLDTMLASHVFDENTPHDLEYLAKVHCGAELYDIPLRMKMFPTPEEYMTVFKYNALDTFYTMKLYFYYMDRFKRTFTLRRLFFKLVMPAARVVEEADYGGHYIRREDFERTKAQLIKDVARSEKELNAMTGTRKKVNWNSPKQIGALLFGKLGLPIIEYTDSGQPATGEAILMELKDLHPIADKLVEYRGYQKFLSTYILGWEELMVGDQLYISTKMHGAVTGRYSSRLHQVPRDGTIRNLIDAPEDEGWVFVCADFSQIELRLAADASDDMRMKLVFQTGGDIHAATASDILGIAPEDLTKEQRKMGKPVNFGYLYGMGWPKFKKYAKENYNVTFTDQEARSHRERFFSVYSGIPEWHDRVRIRVREQGYVEYLSGRLRRLPGVFSRDKMARAEAERQAINSPIQGFGSGDLKAMAMVAIRERFDLDTIQIKGEVHDSILMWVKKDKLKSVLPVVKELMEHPPLFKDFRIELSVPLVVDVDYGGPWGKGVKWEQ